MGFVRGIIRNVLERKYLIAVLLLSTFSFIIILLCIVFIGGRDKIKEIILDDQNYVVSEKYTEEQSQDYQSLHLNKARSRLTGLWVDQATVDNLPVAVMISNIFEAMPQSAIGSADIVFESLVEGGITRLCGLFENGTILQKIGPVRSCRTYYLFFAKEFEATYVHFGYSEYAEKYLQDSNMHSLDGMVYCNFYRTTDRNAPHNAYTSWQGIMESVLYRGYPTKYPSNYIQPYNFNKDDSKDISINNGQKCLTFYPGYDYNNPYFTYNQIEKQYDRFQFDKAQIDAETGTQLKYKNILVKYVTGNYWPNGTPNYIVTGSGKGIFITDGNAIEVIWKNESNKGATKYYYKDGTEIILNQGKTWVCQVDLNNEETVKILDVSQ